LRQLASIELSAHFGYGIRLSKMGAFLFMATEPTSQHKPTRRGKPRRYYVQLENKQMFKISAAKWHSWLAAGLLIVVSACVATPACPGVVWLENGELHEKQDPIAPFMPLNCRVIERHAVYDTRGPRLDPVQLQREIWEDYDRD
jgi:hypothetical protein